MQDGTLSTEDRELLERYAPCLAYDPQDAFIATSAATMTDNDRNALVRGNGDEIAGGASLRLETLLDYPGRASFEPGDHLASGSAREALVDALRMQGDEAYPHMAYGRVVRTGGRIWLQYWLWYYDNPKTFAGIGRHQGDWELVQVGLDEHGASTVTCSQHNMGETRDWANVSRDPRDSDHPLIFVAPFSHANYFQPGTRYYFPAADHPTDVGARACPRIEPFGPWAAWEGRWGADLGKLRGLLRALGGRSPDAPSAQRMRWLEPDAFCAAARRPVNSSIKTAIWWLGKATYPLAPTVHEARLVDGAIEVRYQLHETLSRRASHILVTANGRSGLKPLAGTTRRLGAAVEGVVSLTIHKDEAPHEVWASAFNRAGQRSSLSEPIGVTGA
jgi:hypothetical protein